MLLRSAEAKEQVTRRTERDSLKILLLVSNCSLKLPHNGRVSSNGAIPVVFDDLLVPGEK